MDKQYAINLIRELFENPFSKEKFTIFIKNLLNHIEDAPFVYRGVYIPGIYQEDVKTIERIGKYQDINGKQIDILIVTFLRDETLERARSLQRNIIAWYLNGGRGGKMKDAALVAFISPNNQDWRFSFVKMEYKYDSEVRKIKETYTPAKRYSYLVGPHEASHTAQSMMIPVLLNDKINPTLEEIEAIFKIEKVTKEFFEKYKDLFLNLADQFKNNQEFEEKVVKEHGVNVADFVKKLMGQIVFLYFLQKKGWLGVKPGDKWGSGDKKFMHNLFHKEYCEYDNFYNDVLEPLFYNTLNNRDRKNSSVINDQSYSPFFKCRIPYLNGGLFTPVYDWVKSKIFIDNKYFQDIFDTFDTFNFTVFESDPIEKEVAVDPEMLGKVFENLLEIRDRKSKGAFYTPREIVHYMCQESIIHYLVNKSGYPEERIRKLMQSKDQELARTKEQAIKLAQADDLKEIAIKVNWLLKNVKVCDPAVGSGAFPMKLLKEISTTRFFLNKYFLKERNKNNVLLTEYDIKKDTLENCIYGVDIDPGAVEIARLRFWLSLVVEHDIEEIEPLPNLDYKIMQGNSLIELLSPSLLAKTLDLNRNKIIEQLNIAKNEYFNLSDSLSKSNKREEINLLTRSIVNYDKEKKRENIWEKIKDIRSQMGLFTDKKITEQLNIGDVTSKEISKEFEQLNKIENVSNSEHFEWHLNFNEVFEKGGFDIVIANPPYIRHRDLEKTFKDMLKSKYSIGKTTSDIYCYFYELSYQLLQEKGILSFITSNKWMRAQYGILMRFFFKTNTKILALIDLGSGQFESATVDTNILIFSRQKAETNHVIQCGSKIPDNIYKLGEIYQRDLDNNSFSLINKEKIRLKKKIEKLGVELERWNDIKINYGILTGRNDVVVKGQKQGVFIINEDKRDELIKKDLNSKKILIPILRGRDIYKYGYVWRKKYLVAVHYGMHNEIDNFPAIKDHLTFFKDSLISRAQVKRGDHNWIELDQNPSIHYMKELGSKKLIYPNISQRITVAYEENGFFINQKCFMITGSHLKYLMALLNSKLIFFYFKLIGASLGDVGYEMSKIFIIRLPIIRISEEKEKPFIEIVDKILDIAKSKDYLENLEEQVKVKEYEKQIDQMVYKLYGLTEEEIKIIEANKTP